MAMPRIQDVDLKLLRTFKAIVDAGGLVGAQATLNTSQSTLSTQLSDLEKRIGFRVCQRGRAGFALTKAGQHLLLALEDLFAAADRFQNAAASISGEMKGVLRLSIVDAMLTNTAWNLSAILRDFNARARSAVIELSICSPIEMERLVVEGKRDLAIGPFFRRTSGLTYVPLFQEHHALYCGTDHPLAPLKQVSAAELQQHPFIARGYLHRYDVERVGHLKPAAVVDTMEAQALLIRTGRFIGYLPSHYAASFEGLTRINVVEGLDYLSPIQLLHRTDAQDSILVRSFLGRVAEHPLSKNAEVASGAIRPFGRKEPSARRGD